MNTNEVNAETSETITGYIHNVSPVKMSKNNNKYFNAIIQVNRHDYHQAVIYATEKHQILTLAENNKTPVKLQNARKKISLTDPQKFDIKLTRSTTIDVTDLNFPQKPPQEAAPLKIVDIKSLPPNQMVSRLEAAVYYMEPSSNTVTFNDKECEVRACFIADSTADIQLSLWEDHIDLIKTNNSYTFTNLITKYFNGEKRLTTSRQTTITPLDIQISFTPPDATKTQKATLNNLTAEIEGAVINLLKLCPKCHTSQKDLTIKNQFHRCHSCKILRKTESYLPKCNGILTFQLKDQELGLSICNSILKTFINQQHDMKNMDSRH